MSRCIDDLVNNRIDIKDVYLIVAQTLMPDEERLIRGVEMYCEQGRIDCPDVQPAVNIALQLYHSGRIYQPRVDGHQPYPVDDEFVWMDLAPTLVGGAQATEQVQSAWRAYQLALKLSSVEQLPSMDNLVMETDLYKPRDS